MYLRQETWERLGSEDRILALSTCSGEFSDARTVVLAVMHPRHTDVQEGS